MATNPKKPAAVFTKAEVDALNLRIKDLESQLDEEKKEVKSCYKAIEERNGTIEKLHKVHESIKTEASGGFKEIPVPAMINKPRVVAACENVEKMASCKHVAKFIGALREYIVNN